PIHERRSPRDGDGRTKLEAGEQQPGAFRVPCQPRAFRAADPKDAQERGREEREGVNRAAEQQRENARPDDFRSKCCEALERDRNVDGGGRTVSPTGVRVATRLKATCTR